jgi:hypothetical protein
MHKRVCSSLGGCNPPCLLSEGVAPPPSTKIGDRVAPLSLDLLVGPMPIGGS